MSGKKRKRRSNEKGRTEGENAAGKQPEGKGVAQRFQAWLRACPVGEIALAVLSGILLILIFPKARIATLAYGALVPLFMAIEGATYRQTFALGFLTGFVGYLGILYWLVGTMHIYGHLSTVQSVFLYVLLVSGYVAPLVGGGVVIGRVLHRRFQIPFSLAFPTAWVAFEHLRSWLLSGFPWGFLGYSQIENTTLVQFADLFGVYGVSFFLVFVNAVLYKGIAAWRGNGRKAAPPLLREGIAVATLFLLVLGYGALRKGAVERAIERARSAGETIEVGLIQGNIPQDQKWVAEYRRKTFYTYERLSKQAVAAGATFVIWPETAMPVFHRKGSPMHPIVTAMARRIGCPVLTGCPSYRESIVNGKEERKQLNAAYLIAPDRPPEAAIIGEYDKVHLVPFGEYLPAWIEKLLPFARNLTEAAGNFSPGEETRLLAIEGTPFGTFICYEAIFPDLVRRFVKQGAKFLVNITNDAWFGPTSAPYQHLDMVAMRAVENKVFIARAANTGITAVIEPTGRIRQATRIFEPAWITDAVVFLSMGTLYSRIGDLFAWIALGISLFLPAAAGIRSWRRHRLRHGSHAAPPRIPRSSSLDRRGEIAGGKWRDGCVRNSPSSWEPVRR